ncbi:Sel1 domain protein repeat-containing protein [Bartonella australis AUST/NH1]|uniref:Sel1 domain protein repeat-containing protein n=2 Tax=Bartonella australis TaxID=388640 RepID=M1PE66_BARAA|nr:Sel1 domain protein repeat-containing protein [Bartonella australis AUST/NH1]
MYDYGQGAAQDYPEAVKWYQLAAQQGHALAQHNLGIIHRDGLGAAQNYEAAYMWSIVSLSQQQNFRTLRLRDHVASQLSQKQIARAQKATQLCINSDYKNC